MHHTPTFDSKKPKPITSKRRVACAMLVLIASCGVRADGGAVAHEGLGSKGRRGRTTAGCGIT
jgi:hypothetical protein